MTGMEGRRLHFIAIGGAGMSGLALVCSHLGAQVTGSDRAESSYMERLRAAGLEPHLGHDAELVPPDAEVVIPTARPRPRRCASGRSMRLGRIQPSSWAGSCPGRAMMGRR